MVRALSEEWATREVGVMMRDAPEGSTAGRGVRASCRTNRSQLRFTAKFKKKKQAGALSWSRERERKKTLLQKP